jgi:hypothetical protein
VLGQVGDVQGCSWRGGSVRSSLCSTHLHQAATAVGLVAGNGVAPGMLRSQVIWRLASWRVAAMPRSRSRPGPAAHRAGRAWASSASQAWR